MQNLPKIVRQRLQASMPAVNHPDADLLAAFAEKSLPGLERDSVLEHLARCGDCRDIVALALPTMEPVETGVSRSPSPSSSGWLTWPALRWGFVAAGIAALSWFGILQYQRPLPSPSTASKQAGHVEVAANVSKKAIAPFVAAPSERRDKLQSLAAPAFTDSIDRKDAADEKKSVTHAESSPVPVPPPQTRVGANSFHGAATGGPLPHGPMMANQWQQQSVARNQAPTPAPPSAYSKQGRASDNVSATSAPPAASGADVSGQSATITTEAQNLDVESAAAQPSSADESKVGRAKPAVASNSGGEGLITNQPTRAQAGGMLVTQGTPGQISGLVVDPSGAVVANARITVTPSNKGGSATAVTNSQGAWLIAGLPAGNYRARAEAPGFKTSVLDFTYDASQSSTYRFTLSPGSVSEAVEVSGHSAQVQTEGATIGGLVARLPRWTINASGGLQRSFDQGATWQTVDVEANANAAALAYAGGTSLEIVARTSRAKETKRKDSNKMNQQQASAFVFRAVAANGSEVWAGGSSGALYHSSDAGDHWVRVVPASAGTILTGDIVGLEFTDAQHGKVSTSTTEIWTTSDSGQTWQKQ